MSTITLEDLSNHLRKIDFCMLCTTGSGAMATRPMSNNGDVEYDGNSWFFSYDHTIKIAEIEEMDTVMLTFTAPPSLLGKPGIFVSVQGNASIVRDKTKFEEHWRSGLKRWFPEGPQLPASC
jgi:general stress protein 26